MKATRTETVDRIKVLVHEDRASMGAAAAEDCAARIRKAVEERGECRMIFAAAPSQNELLASLSSMRNLPWDRVVAFHMDEYFGLSPEAPQRFFNFLDAAIFSRVPLRECHGLCRSGLPLPDECARYAGLLSRAPIDIVCLGIGENGHIAFNDPPADFADPFLVKEVNLDKTCRLQQVHDGAFPDLGSVPTKAVTLTVPALLRAAAMFCVVPGIRKAGAVKSMLAGRIDPACPASAMRGHPDCALYLDADSAAEWLAGRSA